MHQCQISGHEQKVRQLPEQVTTSDLQEDLM